MNTKSEILLGRILQKMITNGYCQMEGYNRYAYLSHSSNSLVIGRKDGMDTTIPYSKILLAIQNYQLNPDDFEGNTTTIKNYGISHIYSPIFSLLHMLNKEDYEQ